MKIVAKFTAPNKLKVNYITEVSYPLVSKRKILLIGHFLVYNNIINNIYNLIFDPLDKNICTGYHN